MRRGVQAVADAGRLAPGLTVRAAADVLFALNNIAVYEDLVRERGWSQRRYATFLRDSVRRLLVVG